MAETYLKQMTLIELIKLLASQRQNATMKPGIESAFSDRGYYHQLCFSPTYSCKVSDALALAKEWLDKEYSGYKGGSYKATANTLVTLGQYGEEGEEINEETFTFD